jgi:hypothetical protein
VKDVGASTLRKVTRVSLSHTVGKIIIFSLTGENDLIILPQMGPLVKGPAIPLMNGKFELLYGYVHCRGKTSYSAGFVETEEEAREWVKQHQEGRARRIKVPPGDPLRSCKADFCPFKGQKPWFSFR